MSAALAGACGGLLAYGIGFMDGVAGQRGWRWILILEGLPTFVLGIATWFLLADDPESAYYLSNVSDFNHIVLIRSFVQVFLKPFLIPKAVQLSVALLCLCQILSMPRLHLCGLWFQ